MIWIFVNIRIFTYVKIRLARWVSLILDKYDIKGIVGTIIQKEVLQTRTSFCVIVPSPNLSHTARSFTRLNFVSSVQLVSLGEEWSSQVPSFWAKRRISLKICHPQGEAEKFNYSPCLYTQEGKNFSNSKNFFYRI